MMLVTACGMRVVTRTHSECPISVTPTARKSSPAQSRASSVHSVFPRKKEKQSSANANWPRVRDGVGMVEVGDVPGGRHDDDAGRAHLRGEGACDCGGSMDVGIAPHEGGRHVRGDQESVHARRRLPAPRVGDGADHRSARLSRAREVHAREGDREHIVGDPRGVGHVGPEHPSAHGLRIAQGQARDRLARAGDCPQAQEEPDVREQPAGASRQCEPRHAIGMSGREPDRREAAHRAADEVDASRPEGVDDVEQPARAGATPVVDRGGERIREAEARRVDDRDPTRDARRDVRPLRAVPHAAVDEDGDLAAAAR